MKAKVKNPYFTGKLGGVQFHQAAGGARATVTPAQAAKLRKAYPSVEIVLEEGDEAETAAPALIDIPGLGKASLAKLQEAGVETVAALLEADADELAEKAGIDQAKIEEWQSAITLT